MQWKHEEVVVRVTANQAHRLRSLGWALWKEEHLELGEISRRLLLEHLLFVEAEEGLCGKGHWVDAS